MCNIMYVFIPVPKYLILMSTQICTEIIYLESVPQAIHMPSYVLAHAGGEDVLPVVHPQEAVLLLVQGHRPGQRLGQLEVQGQVTVVKKLSEA